MELKQAKLNFLGDSITEGCGVAAPENFFVNRIAAKTGAICRNYGIGGTRIARQQTPSEVEIWDRDFPSRVAEMDPDADIVVVFGGTNDYGHGDAPFGQMADRSVDTFYGALHVLYTSLRQRFPHAKIVVLTPLHRLYEAETEPNLPAYVQAIHEVAAAYSLPVLDLYANCKLNPADPEIMERYVPDGLHPNDAGHAILAEDILRFLEQL